MAVDTATGVGGQADAGGRAVNTATGVGSSGPELRQGASPSEQYTSGTLEWPSPSNAQSEVGPERAPTFELPIREDDGTGVHMTAGYAANMRGLGMAWVQPDMKGIGWAYSKVPIAGSRFEGCRLVNEIVLRENIWKNAILAKHTRVVKVRRDLISMLCRNQDASNYFVAGHVKSGCRIELNGLRVQHVHIREQFVACAMKQGVSCVAYNCKTNDGRRPLLRSNCNHFDGNSTSPAFNEAPILRVAIL